MSSYGICRLEDVTLSYGPAHSPFLKSQFFKTVYEETLITKWSFNEVGYIALVIRDVIPVTESHEGTSSGKFLD